MIPRILHRPGSSPTRHLTEKITFLGFKYEKRLFLPLSNHNDSKAIYTSYTG